MVLLGIVFQLEYIGIARFCLRVGIPGYCSGLSSNRYTGIMLGLVFE